MPHYNQKPSYQQEVIGNDEHLLTGNQAEDIASAHFLMKVGGIEKIVMLFPYRRPERPENRHVEVTIRLNGINSEKLVGCTSRKWKDAGALLGFYGR